MRLTTRDIEILQTIQKNGNSLSIREIERSCSSGSYCSIYNRLQVLEAQNFIYRQDTKTNRVLYSVRESILSIQAKELGVNYESDELRAEELLPVIQDMAEIISQLREKIISMEQLDSCRVEKLRQIKQKLGMI